MLKAMMPRAAREARKSKPANKKQAANKPAAFPIALPKL
jgi:hypothetical protein